MDYDDWEDAYERIQEAPLSVEVRSGWTLIGQEAETEEFRLLLTFGGPALRIVGDINGGYPERCRLEHQDWGTPWTEHMDADRDALQAFCSHFCFE
jgi:hypothetical protein